MSAQPKKKHYSIAEYMELEASAAYKSEYHEGEILSMAGGTIRHGEIGGNVLYALKNKLKGKICKPYNNDVQVATSDYHYVYPDAFVVCGDVKQGEFNKNAIANPTLVVEVLSESTKEYDRTEKFKVYMRIPSFREYVVIEQTKPWVEVYFRESEKHWHLFFYKNLNEIVTLQSINCQVSMQEIYEDIIFDEEIQERFSSN